MTLHHQRSHAGGVQSADAFPAPSIGLILPQAQWATLLEPADWRDSLHAYVRATHLAVALSDTQGNFIGACLNPQPTWQYLQAAASAVAPTARKRDQRGVLCPFALLPREPCTCIADALAQGRVVFARDRTRLVHFAVPLILGGYRLGVVLAGQVFDQYPEQIVLEQAARQLDLSLAALWQKARLEVPIKQDTLRVYANLLANLSQTFLQTRYDALQEAKRLAEMTRLRDQAERAEAALQQINVSLEQRVAERTADLQQAHEALSQEISERQRMQEALFQREKLAALGTLLANVAHELNNPLAVASMELDRLEEEEASDGHREAFATLRQAVDRCGSVVKGFLDMVRHQPPTRRAVDLNALIGDALALLGHTLEVDGIAVHCHLGEVLPSLWADPHQLYHVITNLITNAHHALQQTDGPRHLTLTTTAQADPRQVILSVADTGAGIPADLQRRIFDPFFTTKPQGVGSGLGLPLCRNIVEGHGGSLYLDSESGHGTTVSVTLPVGTAQPTCRTAAPEATAPEPQRPGTVLLIDDETAMVKSLTRLLQRSGHDIILAVNGYEGLAALEERTPDVILCDMRMPELDGPGFYQELEQRHPHLTSRVIFLTGDVLTPEIQDFFARVDRPRLVKPFRAAEVRQVIQQVLEETPPLGESETL